MATRLAVDRFHRKGHKHPMCATLTNADCTCNGNKEVFEGVNSSVAEQSFSFLTKFKLSLRSLAYPNSTIYMILLLHLWNAKRTNLSPDDFGVATRYFSETIMPMFLTKCVYETTQSDANTTTNQMESEVDDSQSEEYDLQETNDLDLYEEMEED